VDMKEIVSKVESSKDEITDSNSHLEPETELMDDLQLSDVIEVFGSKSYQLLPDSLLEFWLAMSNKK
jgi:hypothetical protein